ncbi:MAG: 3-deoxy-D-manno-octulosonate 8-phosphate phosphatase [Ginsengibacter sp.]
MNVLVGLQNVKAFVFDMDGVLTDGSLIVDYENKWLRTMNIKDGYALQLAAKTGYHIAIISGSDAPPVVERLHKLGITDVFMKVTDKKSLLEKYMIDNALPAGQVLFMGDDIPDYECMQTAGFASCPADAAIEIRQLCSYISPFKGGHGCVRDVIEKVMKLNNHWPLHTSFTST